MLSTAGPGDIGCVLLLDMLVSPVVLLLLALSLVLFWSLWSPVSLTVSSCLLRVKPRYLARGVTKAE